MKTDDKTENNITSCPKCESPDLRTRLFKRGQLIWSSSPRREETEFVTSSEFDFYFRLNAKKEHLRRICQTCGHKWREPTKDDKTISSR